MQPDGWSEVDVGILPDMINDQDVLQAKNNLLNWIKDLRAQPEVHKEIWFIFLLPRFIFITILKVFSCDADRFAAKCLAWGACGKSAGGPTVSLALGPCTQSADCYGTGHVGFNVAAAQ